MRILVISGDKASNNTGNGKTILNVAKCFPEAEVFSFYHRGLIDEADPVHFYRFADRDALDALKKRKQKVTDRSPIGDAPQRKTAWRHLVRYWVWKLSGWRGRGFDQWVDSAKPDIVLLYLSDDIYQTELANKISIQTKASLFVFTGEDYPLKDYDYISKSLKRNFGFRLFVRKMRSVTKRTLSSARTCLFNSPSLERAYADAFKMRRSMVLYPVSEKMPESYVYRPIRKVIYGGSYGLNRWRGLVDIAQELLSFDSQVKLLVYGKGDDEGTRVLSGMPNVEMMGYVSNEELDTAIKEADLLVHSEAFDDYSRKDLRFAFSTKIVESVMSGRPFLLYAPKCFAEYDYCASIQGPLLASSKEELHAQLKRIFEHDFVYELDRPAVIHMHSIEENRKRIKELLE